MYNLYLCMFINFKTVTSKIYKYVLLSVIIFFPIPTILSKFTEKIQIYTNFGGTKSIYYKTLNWNNYKNSLDILIQLFKKVTELGVQGAGCIPSPPSLSATVPYILWLRERTWDSKWETLNILFSLSFWEV